MVKDHGCNGGVVVANQQQLEILKKGVSAWNVWRDEHPKSRPDLFDCDLAAAELGGAHLEQANLCDCRLESAKLNGAHLRHADLGGARLLGADLSGASAPLNRGLGSQLLRG